MLFTMPMQAIDFYKYKISIGYTVRTKILTRETAVAVIGVPLVVGSLMGAHIALHDVIIGNRLSHEQHESLDGAIKGMFEVMVGAAKILKFVSDLQK